MISTGLFPFWVIVANWWMQRKYLKRNQDLNDVINYMIWKFVLENLKNHWPVPHGRIETRITARVMSWIDREMAQIILAQKMTIAGNIPESDPLVMEFIRMAGRGDI